MLLDRKVRSQKSCISKENKEPQKKKKNEEEVGGVDAKEKNTEKKTLRE